MKKFKILWLDGGREPQCAPDPNYPNGIDLDCSANASLRCNVSLPYPAKRCGMYLVECKTCGTNILITTAGRLDDPRSVTIACTRSTRMVH